MNAQKDQYSLKSTFHIVMKIALTTAIGLLLGASENRVLAQGPFIDSACKENCALTDAACIAREQVCQTKLQLYRGYMGQLGLGLTLHRLPQLYIDLLQAHYNGSLGNVSFGYADRQPALATTDCNVIYFGTSATRAFVDKVKNGGLTHSAEFKLLFHELRHFSQCTNLGGRDQFAKRWFRDLDISILHQTNVDFQQLHDLMPMEADAKNAADRIFGEIDLLRDQSGKLVRPLSVELLKGNSVLGSNITAWVGSPLEFTARVSGGSGPFKIDWSVKAPYEVRAQSAQPAPGDLSKLQWSPNREGIFEVEAFVTQPGTSLRPALKIIQVKADSNPLPVGTISLNNGSVPSKLQVRTPTFRILNVEVRRSLSIVSSTANVCVIDSANQQVYGRKHAESSVVSFSVPVGRSVDITVSALRFVGRTQVLTMADSDRSLVVTLNQGSGGPTCSVQ